MDYKLLFEYGEQLSEYSLDPSTKIGAIVFDEIEQVIVGCGYNTFPIGCRHLLDDHYENREMKYEIIIHAEIRALFSAYTRRNTLRDCSIIVWPPMPFVPTCSRCAGPIIDSEIKKVVYKLDSSINDFNERWKASSIIAQEMYNKANVEVIGVN